MISLLSRLKISKRASKYIGVFTIVAFALIKGASVLAVGSDFRLNYLLPKSEIRWVKDLDSLAPEIGFDRYYLFEDPSIDILFSFSQDDNLKELEEKGLDSFISHISRGKNMAQSIVSDDPIKLSHVIQKNESPRKIVSFETEYALGKNRYSTYESFYLYQNSGLHATLRWNQNSSIELLKKARLDLAEIQILQKAESHGE